MGSSRILLTRPYEDSLELSYQLEKIGRVSLINPMMQILPLKRCPEELLQIMPGYCAGWILTSAHAVPEFVRLRPKYDRLPIFVIGHKTAGALVDQGIKVQGIADNDSRSLMRLLQANAAPGKEYIHICGRYRSAMFQREQEVQNIPITSFPVYEAVAEKDLNSLTRQTLNDRKIDMVMFYSARTAGIFQKLIEKNQLRPCLSATQALCLAPSVVNSLRIQDWGGAVVASRPDTVAMLDLVRSLT